MASKAIVLLGRPLVTEEKTAAAAITPGHLIEIASATTVAVHSTAAANAAKTFALERDELGDDIDTAYAIGDEVKVGAFAAGMRVNALIASGENVVAGTFLESDGDGTLIETQANVATDNDERNGIVGIATETVDNSSGPGDARICVEIV